MATLVCTIDLDKNAGLTLTVRDEAGSVTQTVTMNGTTIVLKVAGAAATSTVTQSSDAVSIACQRFEVKATEQVTLSANQISIEGQAQLSGKAAQIEIKSDALLSLESSGPATLKGALTNVQGNLVNVG